MVELSGWQVQYLPKYKVTLYVRYPLFTVADFLENTCTDHV
jgi:hypothetical protein